MASSELVSVVMPAYNAENFILESVESVLTQSYTNLEIIIVDDCSTDNTFNLISAIAQRDNRVRLYRNDSNCGVAITRNVAIEAAKGKYIAFLDSDDIWLSNKLEVQVAALESACADVACSSYIRFYSDKTEQKVIVKEHIDFEEMLKGNAIGNLTGIYNAVKLGKVYQKKIGHEDYLMWLEIVRRSENVLGIMDVLARYRVGGGLSSNKFRAAIWTWRIYRDELELSLGKSLVSFSNYIFMNVCKRL